MTASHPNAGAAPAKSPPEALSLRVPPRAVKRLSRKALAILIGVAVLVVAGAAIWALRSPRSGSTTPDQLYSTDRKPAADGLVELPSDYGSVPPLGPPLPGDLGEPILNAQEETVPGAINRQATSPSAAEQAALAERQRKAQERRTAIASPLLAISGQSAMGAIGRDTQFAALTIPDLIVDQAPSDAGEQSIAERRSAFLAPANSDARTLSASRLQKPASPFTVMAGAMIPAALVTGINSDLPGQVIATVTSPVYDTVTGRHLLIPQGARLLGLYDSDVGYGEERTLLIWTRLILPDGSSLVLERMPATDQAGYAGVADRVDHHWRRLATGAALSTSLGVGAELAAPRNQGRDDRIVIAGRDGLQDSVNQIGQEITRRNLDIKPTITIRPGYPIRVMVNRDLQLAPYRDDR